MISSLALPPFFGAVFLMTAIVAIVAVNYSPGTWSTMLDEKELLQVLFGGNMSYVM
jgi:hypothetical protein